MAREMYTVQVALPPSSLHVLFYSARPADTRHPVRPRNDVGFFRHRQNQFNSKYDDVFNSFFFSRRNFDCGQMSSVGCTTYHNDFFLFFEEKIKKERLLWKVYEKRFLPPVWTEAFPNG